jgi:hypothetical protein
MTCYPSPFPVGECRFQVSQENGLTGVNQGGNTHTFGFPIEWKPRALAHGIDKLSGLRSTHIDRIYDTDWWLDHNLAHTGRSTNLSAPSDAALVSISRTPAVLELFETG